VESRSEVSRSASERVPPKISPFRWALWWVTLFFALILFYGLFAPFWFGLRAAAWAAEFRARRHRAALRSLDPA
jgi:lauroyl/myristoyl acyltransferase